MPRLGSERSTVHFYSVSYFYHDECKAETIFELEEICQVHGAEPYDLTSETVQDIFWQTLIVGQLGADSYEDVRSEYYVWKGVIVGPFRQYRTSKSSHGTQSVEEALDLSFHMVARSDSDLPNRKGLNSANE